MKANPTNHALCRIAERMPMPWKQVVQLLEEEKCVKVGEEQFSNNDHFAIYDKTAKQVFVVFRDATDGTLVTVWDVAYYTKRFKAIHAEVVEEAKRLNDLPVGKVLNKDAMDKLFPHKKKQKKQTYSATNTYREHLLAKARAANRYQAFAVMHDLEGEFFTRVELGKFEADVVNPNDIAFKHALVQRLRMRCDQVHFRVHRVEMEAADPSLSFRSFDAVYLACIKEETIAAVLASKKGVKRRYRARVQARKAAATLTDITWREDTIAIFKTTKEDQRKLADLCNGKTK